MKPEHELYRKEALTQISSPEHLDEIIQITTPKNWILLWVLLGILVLALIWAFVGTIPARVYGEGIFLAEKESDNKVGAIFYFSQQQGKKIQVDQVALITPNTVSKEEYGSIQSIVSSVSPYPVSQQEMMAVLKNENLVQQLSQQGAPIAIRVRLEKDSHTNTGWKWTTSQGPSTKIMPGTLAKISIVVQKRKPITLIIPAFKKLLGN